MIWRRFQEITLNGFTPQRVVLSGSYASGNQFSVRRINPGPPVEVVLQPDRLGMAEMGYPDAPVEATLSKVFATGRALRLVDRSAPAVSSCRLCSAWSTLVAVVQKVFC